MSESSFWRTEVWHPLTVHFPVALLLIATIFKVIALWLRPEPAVFWQRAGSYLLYAGCGAAWLSIYTGEMADGIVARKLCDPRVLKDHQIAAYNLAYIFSATAILDRGIGFHLIRHRKKLIRFLVAFLLLAGSAFLIRAGHSGARVVYQQGGGVRVPAGDCSDYP